MNFLCSLIVFQLEREKSKVHSETWTTDFSSPGMHIKIYCIGGCIHVKALTKRNKTQTNKTQKTPKKQQTNKTEQHLLPPTELEEGKELVWLCKKPPLLLGTQ